MSLTEDGKRALSSYVDSEQLSPICELAGEYTFQLGVLTPKITIRVYTNLEDKRIYFEQSHFIKTPVQAGQYQTDVKSGNNIIGVLLRVIRDFTSYYNEAIKANNTPNDSWLVPNPEF